MKTLTTTVVNPNPNTFDETSINYAVEYAARATVAAKIEAMQKEITRLKALSGLIADHELQLQMASTSEAVKLQGAAMFQFAIINPKQEYHHLIGDTFAILEEPVKQGFAHVGSKKQD